MTKDSNINIRISPELKKQAQEFVSTIRPCTSLSEWIAWLIEKELQGKK